MKWKKPPKFVQRDRYVEGEMDLDRCVRRWSGPEVSSGSGEKWFLATFSVVALTFSAPIERSAPTTPNDTACKI